MGGGLGEQPPPTTTYTEVFRKVFPSYLAMGMTYDQFYNDDCTLVKAYREADQLRIDRKNTEMWLQGRYIYEAVGALAPIFHAFAKRGTKAGEYLSEPFPLTEKEVQRRQEQKQKERYYQLLADMKARVQRQQDRKNKEG